MDNSISNEIKLKEPKSFEEQLQILKDRNMKIEDEELAISVLKMTNYYRITVYALQFKTEEGYTDEATFNTMYRLYKFDKRLRHIILEILESIEISLRTYMAYHLSIKYGAEAQKNEEIFENKEFYTGYDEIGKMHHNGLVDEIRNEIKKNRKELFVRHHMTKYNGHFPIWVVVELFSFGMLSKMYINLKLEDKKAIATNCFNVNYKLLESWLNNLSYIRNICAHYGRLYNKKMTITPMIHNKYKKDELVLNRLFISILAIKELTKNISEWDSFKKNLETLINEYIDVIDLNLIGFPDNWNEILSRN